MSRVLLLLAALLPAAGQDIFDLLLKNGQVIDPANSRKARLDIAISQGKIVRIGPGIPTAHARRVVDVSDYFVTPGLIDLQPHLEAEHHSLRAGVTTVALPALPQPPVPTRLHQVTSGKTGTAAASLKPGDILSNAYSLPLTELAAARKRGAILNASHGTGNFLFRIAVPAIRQGLLPDIISTAMDKESLLLPRATMTNVMSKFLALGLSLEQVVTRTTANTARALRLPEAGAIRIGGPADLAVLELRNGPAAYLDSSLAKLTGNVELRCVLTVVDGTVVWDSEGLSLTNWKEAGPYSNFK